MECEVVRTRLLTCEPGELAGTGDTAVARHVRSCDDCGRLARSLLRDQRELARALDETASREGGRAVEEALARIDERVERRPRRWRLWAPLAAVAVLLVALLPSGDGDGGGDRAPPPTVDRAPRSGFAIEASAGRPVTVLQTSDPDVVVVWFHTDRERSER